MCGVFGIVQLREKPISEKLVFSAHEAQRHRGPDSQKSSLYNLGNTSVLLGHERLSIIDLGSQSDQPMDSANSSIVFNGELYNYIELREILKSEGIVFNTNSDTEVLLAALNSWGVEKALNKFNWMGAFGLLDRSEGKLYIARDNCSEKPLYYYTNNDRFIFASELKTTLLLSENKFTLNKNAIGQYLFQGITDASEESIFENIYQLPPSTVIVVEVKKHKNQKKLSYEGPKFSKSLTNISFSDFIEELKDMMIDSVDLRLRSDVPTGILLSGGIDSSTIASIAHMSQKNGVKSTILSATSDDKRFDESYFIDRMGSYLKCPIEKVKLEHSPKMLSETIASLNWINDFPISSLSAVSYQSLMVRAKELGIKVILSGQGADETLLGYRKFLFFYLKYLIKKGRIVKSLGTLLPFLISGNLMREFNFADAKRYMPFNKNSSNGLEGDWLSEWKRLELGLGDKSLKERQILDINNFSVPALCHYEDRISMSQSIEVRLPFLDTRLIDMLLRVPDDWKISRGWTKYVLRKAMDSILPKEISWRKDKKGFSNPESEWLKSEFKQEALDIFSKNSLIHKLGIIDVGEMIKKYKIYCKQPYNSGGIWYREIFAPISLEIWLRQYQKFIS